jgi:hypothetical protein
LRVLVIEIFGPAILADEPPAEGDQEGPDSVVGEADGEDAEDERRIGFPPGVLVESEEEEEKRQDEGAFRH